MHNYSHLNIDNYRKQIKSVHCLDITKIILLKDNDRLHLMHLLKISSPDSVSLFEECRYERGYFLPVLAYCPFSGS
jgi:hypothetical protein